MQARPTILQIIPRLDTGGAELSTLEITAAVVAAGGRMLVATEGGRLAPEIGRLGGELVTMPAASKNPAVMLANARRLVGLVRGEEIALLHARSRAPAWSALVAARRTGRPFVTTYHGAYGSKGRLKTAYNSVMARGDIVIANSHFTARLIEERHGTAREKLVVIHRGVDLDRFDPAKVTPARLDRLRRDWRLDPAGKVVLQAARITGWKGQSVLIDAAARLHREGRLGSAVVVLAGDAQGRDGYADRLRAQIAGHGLGDRVRLVGHCDDIAAAFLLAHVTVVASTEAEAFGRAATEAMAMGCPVIATDLGAPPETVLAAPATTPDRITGWLVPPGDAAALAERLFEALCLPDSAREAIGTRARAHVTAHFSVRNMQAATLAVYDGLVGSSLRAAFLAAGRHRHGLACDAPPTA
jgi:glycosyltransferase involved in cell wall biosynthesis